MTGTMYTGEFIKAMILDRVWMHSNVREILSSAMGTQIPQMTSLIIGVGLSDNVVGGRGKDYSTYQL